MVAGTMGAIGGRMGLDWRRIELAVGVTALVVGTAALVIATVGLGGGAPSAAPPVAHHDPPTTTTTTGAAAPAAATNTVPASTLVATTIGDIPGYPAPGPPSDMTVPGSWYGYPSVLPVISTEPGWLDVRLAQRPNGSTTWVQPERRDAREHAVRHRRQPDHDAPRCVRRRRADPRLPRRHRRTQRPHPDGQLLRHHAVPAPQPRLRAVRAGDLRPLRTPSPTGRTPGTPSSPSTGRSTPTTTRSSGRPAPPSPTAASGCTMPTWPSWERIPAGTPVEVVS